MRGGRAQGEGEGEGEGQKELQLQLYHYIPGKGAAGTGTAAAANGILQCMCCAAAVWKQKIHMIMLWTPMMELDHLIGIMMMGSECNCWATDRKRMNCIGE
jgi:hypothetical protein